MRTPFYTGLSLAGPSPALWHRCPWTDFVANPANGIVYFEEFIQRPHVSETADQGTWLASLVDAGGDNGEVLWGIVDDERGGAGTLVTNDADNDVNNLQLNGAPWLIASMAELWYETRFKVNDADTCDFFIGLATPVTNVLAAVTNVLGFLVAAGDSSQALTFTGDKATAQSDNSTGITMADDTYVKAGFHVYEVNGAFVADCFINGSLLGTAQMANANIPVVAMSPIVCIRNASAAASTMEVDFIRCAQTRIA